MTHMTTMSVELECPPEAEALSDEPVQAVASMRQLSPDELRAVTGGPVVQNDSR